MKGMIGVWQSGEYIATYVPPVLRRISWPAVGAGVGVALLIQLLLSIHGHLHQWLMGVGVGIGTMDPTRIKMLATAEFGGIPGLCWQSLGLIALLIGSGVASRVAEAPYRHEGMLHGLLTWGVVMLCALCLPATLLGSFMSGTLGTLAATVHTTSQASFGIMPAPLVGAIVAVLGGAIGTLRSL
jgi:hypothetical protein